MCLSPQIFDEAEAMGFAMELLDVGGGFTGHFDAHGNVMFGEIANTINSSLAKHFPPEMGVRVIAEPGRYFAETSASLLTPVYGQRDRVDGVTGKISKDYWLTDGLVSVLALTWGCSSLRPGTQPATQLDSAGPARVLEGRGPVMGSGTSLQLC